MKHISDEVLLAYIAGRLSGQEEIEIMEHIAMCDNCAERFAGMLTEENMISPPPDLKSEILEQTVYRKSPVRTIQEIQERKRAKQRELLGYAVKVGVAMAASILMVISISTDSVTRQKHTQEAIGQELVIGEGQEEQGGRKNRNRISGSLQEVSNKMGDALTGFFDIFEKEEGE